MTGVFQVTEDSAQFLHPPDVQQARGVGQGGGADFHHNTFVFHGKAPLENRGRGVPPVFFGSFIVSIVLDGAGPVNAGRGGNNGNRSWGTVVSQLLLYKEGGGSQPR